MACYAIISQPYENVGTHDATCNFWCNSLCLFYRSMDMWIEVIATSDIKIKILFHCSMVFYSTRPHGLPKEVSHAACFVTKKPDLCPMFSTAVLCACNIMSKWIVMMRVNYLEISNIGCTKSQKLNVSHLVLQFSLRRQAMLKLHLSDEQF